ncbi:MAG: aminomethyl-transferring glycine dehydrogenase [Oligoflexia bacterium]|nr:aminomethyl-transferring glycine dehydrogenase [Oligoflexia bacterium]
MGKALERDSHQAQKNEAVMSGESFVRRHIGPSAEEQKAMLKLLGHSSLDEFISAVVPQQIAMKSRLQMKTFDRERSEPEVLAWLGRYAAENKCYRSYIGQGYYGCLTPGVILRNILENPGWYTQYTPYQPEISQGRLEALLNFQSMICDFTGLAISNASLLDEGTAAAEAMNMALGWARQKGREKAKRFLVSDACHTQTIEVLRTRAEMIDVVVEVAAHDQFRCDESVIGMLLQYPTSLGAIPDYRALAQSARDSGAVVVVASDLLALALLTPPGEWGADIVVGSAQRFGVPMGFGGPHAAFMATRDEMKRIMPGRLVGVSKDSYGRPALRLSLQTREQHIRRERATSNICTAQVLLAVMASMYAVYHGPQGIRAIAQRVHGWTKTLADELSKLGLGVRFKEFFDTLHIVCDKGGAEIAARAEKKQINLRKVDERSFAVSLDETVTAQDVADLLWVFGGDKAPSSAALSSSTAAALPKAFQRQSAYLTHPVFNSYHSETEMLRYIKRLESRDLSLANAMIPLGSCTMKLNATAEMLPVTWKEFAGLHPFAPESQTLGYRKLFTDLEQALCEITGFDAASLQPNAGSQGEYAGLVAIRAYHQSRGQSQRNVCLIPHSAHGTNPASAAMAGFEIVVVECDEHGNIDVDDLKLKISENKEKLAALMATYPSTHGVFEERIKEVTELVHAAGGQVYMDGANLNALVGLVRPADIGADVCHINLHKTFCIPHGGGGPGMGPIAVRSHLAPFLPGHPIVNLGHKGGVGPISAAPWGSACILVIPWVYMALMGARGLEQATKVAILNANYIAKRLEGAFPVLYRGKNDFVAHECILDLRFLKKNVGLEVVDVAKRLMDFNFHAPTVSFPVAETLMVEPTESESLAELDRFCDAMLSIREEIRAVESGKVKAAESLLKLAPHTALDLASSEWSRPYTREQAVFPSKETRECKFWPSVNRIDAAYGDKNLVCSCLPIEAYR